MPKVKSLDAIQREQLRKEYEQLAKRGLEFRSVTLDSSLINEQDRSVRTILFTENPVIVIDWSRYELIREVLICTPDACQLPASDQLPMLDNHNRFSSDDVKGSMREFSIANSLVDCRSFFSTTEEKLWTKVKEKHITDVSGGYRTYKESTLRIPPGESGVIGGRTFANNFEDNLDLVIRTKWLPFEGSVTPIGADVMAKFRSAMNGKPGRRAACDHKETRMVSDCCGAEMDQEDIDEGTCPDCGEDCSPVEQCRSCGKEMKRNSVIKINSRSSQMTEEEKRAYEAQVRKELEEKFGKRQTTEANIRAIARDFQAQVPNVKLTDEAEKYIAERSSKEDFNDTEFRALVMNKMKEANSLRTPPSATGMSDKDLEKVSFREIVLALADKTVDKLGVAYEASRTVADKLGRAQGKDNFFLPYELQKRQIQMPVNQLTPEMKRDLNVTDPAGGGYGVHYQYIPQSFIEILLNATVLPSLGVQVIENLQGDVPMVRELSSNIFYWVGEGNAPTQSDITFGQQFMRPKTGGALTKLTHKFLLQNSLGGEAYAMRKLGLATAVGYDKGALYGTGSDAQPLGLKNQTGLGGVTGAGFTRSKALQCVAQILTANALVLGDIKWLTDPISWSVLADRLISQYSAKYLWDENDNMVGYNGLKSNQVEAGDLFGGIWSAMLLGMWNVVEVKANEFGTGFAAGQIEVRSLVDLDTFVEYPGAFTLTTAVS